MTTPAVVPTKYAGDDGDYLIAKIDRSGALRSETVSVTVPDASSVGTVVGLVPFRKGARFNYGASSIYAADLDTATSVTLNVGYVYDDNTTYTNDDDAFATLSTAAQAGGFVTFDEVAGFDFDAEADGWIAVTIAGGATTTEGDIDAQIALTYD